MNTREFSDLCERAGVRYPYSVSPLASHTSRNNLLPTKRRVPKRGTSVHRFGSSLIIPGKNARDVSAQPRTRAWGGGGEARSATPEGQGHAPEDGAEGKAWRWNKREKYHSCRRERIVPSPWIWWRIWVRCVALRDLSCGAMLFLFNY